MQSYADINICIKYVIIKKCYKSTNRPNLSTKGRKLAEKYFRYPSAPLKICTFAKKITAMKDNFVNRQSASKAERLRFMREYDKACDDDINGRPAGKVRIVWLSYASRDESANLITEKEYDFARDQSIHPSNLTAYVSNDGKYGLVDMTGREILPCKYDAIGGETRGKRWMKIDGRWRVFDIRSRRFSDESYLGEYALGCLLVQRSDEGKLGALDFNGKVVVPFEYVKIELREIGSYVNSWEYHILVLYLEETAKVDLFRLATPDGNLYSDEIYDIPPYQWEFGEAINCTDCTWTSYGPLTITCRENGKGILKGLLNVKTGKRIMPCECNSILFFGHILDKDYYRCTRQGICCVIDENGNEIIPGSMRLSDIGKLPYDESEYLIPACCDGKWGYINMELVEKIPFKYDSAGDFDNGIARVETRGNYFYIDHHGRFVPDKSSDN